MGDFKFTTGTVFEIIATVAVYLLVGAFFVRKKSVKLLIIYTGVVSLQISAVLLDSLFSMRVTYALVSAFTTFMLIVWVVVYQSDFRVLFFNLTHRRSAGDKSQTLTDDELRVAVDEIVRACQTMSKSRTGALIVLAPTSVAPHILETGTELGALVTAPLLESIFNTKAPFHDGAVIIKGNRVLAAGCFLPLSQSTALAKSIGTRHRAGVGITEETDMITVICSEETGIISVAKRGDLKRFITPDRLRDILYEIFNVTQSRKA
ncbi:MAG: diadenylate cyclase [Firmicutes bacterium]|nr:diadenylate cyclase [Bacillota bacterium]